MRCALILIGTALLILAFLIWRIYKDENFYRDNGD